MFSKIKEIIQAVQLCLLMRKFKGMVMCSDKYIEDLADKIGYGALLAFYELHIEQQEDMAWDEFVTRVQYSPAIRKKIQKIAGRAVLFFDRTLLNFELPVDALDYRENYPDEQLINTSRIFPEKMAYALIENVFLMFELEHFKRLATSAPGYSWAAYCDDLSNDKGLWNQFTRGLQHGLSQIDYKACWKTNTTPEEILRLEFCEKG